MDELFKVTQHNPEQTKHGIKFSLVNGSIRGQASIKIDEGSELFFDEKQTHIFKKDQTGYSISLVNTFIEHWGGVINCYVFKITDI